MTRTILECVGICALAASCNVDDGRHTINVAEQNDLGVITLETLRVQDHANTVYTLRAFSADAEVASVRLTTGEIPDLSQWAPGGDDVGSEIQISAAGSESHIVTRETHRFNLPPSMFRDPNIARFLALGVVSSTLEGDANVFGLPTEPLGDVAYLGHHWTIASCPASYMNTSPVAGQCCATQLLSPYIYWTDHVNPTNQATAERERNPVGPGTPCRASNGTSTCSGADCFYGPNGFAVPDLHLATPQNPYGFVNWLNEDAPDSGKSCFPIHVASPPTPQFSDVHGTNPTGCGCCGNGSGACCGSACASCTVVPQSAAMSHWDS